MNSERKQYMKGYRETYLKDKVRKEILFSNNDFNQIKKEAIKNKTNPSAYIKETVLASLNDSYFFPHKESLNKIQLLILNIGNNINQIAKYTNEKRTLGIFKAKKILDYLNNLETKLENYITSNFDLLLSIKEKIENNPNLIYEIECIIYKQKLKRYDFENNQVEKQ
jgi:hypothetical protein